MNTFLGKLKFSIQDLFLLLARGACTHFFFLIKFVISFDVQSNMDLKLKILKLQVKKIYLIQSLNYIIEILEERNTFLVTFFFTNIMK